MTDMPTSSEKLRARASACLKGSELLNKEADDADDPLEAEALYRVAKQLWIDYGRYKTLAENREKKEQEYEHRRKQG